MKNVLIIITICLSVCLTGCGHRGTKAEQVKVDTLSLIVQSVQSTRLYTAEYDIHKIVTKDDVLKVKGQILQHQFDVSVPLGDRKILIPIDVTLKAYIDFSAFSEKNIRREGDRIHLILPDPRVVVVSSKIDHYQVKQFVSLTRSQFTSEEINNYARQGEEAVIRTVPEIGILRTAETSAARLLIPMMVKLGYKEENITVSFRKTFGQQDMPLLWDREGKAVQLK